LPITVTSGSNSYSDDFPAHLHIIFQSMVVENVCIFGHMRDFFVVQRGRAWPSWPNGKYAYADIHGQVAAAACR